MAILIELDSDFRTGSVSRLGIYFEFNTSTSLLNLHGRMLPPLSFYVQKGSNLMQAFSQFRISGMDLFSMAGPAKRHSQCMLSANSLRNYMIHLRSMGLLIASDTIFFSHKTLHQLNCLPTSPIQSDQKPPNGAADNPP
jgi:hypothetical protein